MAVAAEESRARSTLIPLDEPEAVIVANGEVPIVPFSVQQLTQLPLRGVAALLPMA